MAEPLGTRLMRAGLVTKRHLEQALKDAPPASAALQSGAQLTQILADMGIEEDALAGFFVSLGFGPLIQGEQLRDSRDFARSLFSPSVSAGLLSYPVRESEQGLVIAMADPSDSHALKELGFATGKKVLPALARISDLRSAIDAAWPNAIATWKSDTTRDTVETMEPSLSVPSEEAEPSLLASDPGPVPVPLVRTKTYQPERAQALVSTPEGTEQKPSLSDPPEKVIQLGEGDAPPKTNSWQALLGKTSRTDPSGSARRAPAPPPGQLGVILSKLRRVSDRDEALALCCEGAALFGRCAVLLVLSKGVFKGRQVVGESLSPDAVRNLWIPARSASLLKKVHETLSPYRGPFTPSAADQIFRAAIRSRGGDTFVQPLAIHRRIIGAVLVDEPYPGVDTEVRIEACALATGTALEKIIVAKKHRT